MTRGIVILALGHPQYGQLATNLAATIRMNAGVNIHLVYDQAGISHLNQSHLSLFNSKSECPVSAYQKNGKNVYIRAKLNLPELSPFDETLYLDADMAWLSGKHPYELMDKLSITDFTMQCRGRFDLAESVPPKSNSWCDVNEAVKAYDLKGYWYQLSSDLFYFKKTDAVKDYFRKALEIFDNPLCKVVEFDGDVPDEFAFSVAANLCMIGPLHPYAVYAAWFGIERPTVGQLKEKYYAYAIGGNRIDNISLSKYNDIVKAAYRVLNLGNYFPIVHKKQWNPKRNKL